MAAREDAMEGRGWVLRNEFARVKLEVDRDAGAPRLRITDLKSGEYRFLDALQVECLLRLEPEVFDRLLPY